MSEVNAEVGSPEANSYVTVAEADAYFGDAFGKSLWATLDAAVKASLVITSSRTLDQYISWNGQKATTEQSMEWPRIYTCEAVDVIPIKVKYATYELAYYMSENDGLSFSNQTVDSVKVGPVAVDFTARSTDAGIPSFIENLIASLGSSIIPDASSVRMAKLVRS